MGFPPLRKGEDLKNRGKLNEKILAIVKIIVKYKIFII
jgi:hypothetical protein